MTAGELGRARQRHRLGADEEIVTKVSSLLDPDLVQGAINDAVDLLRADDAGGAARRDALRREIEANASEQARLVEAIVSAPDVAALTAALKAREQRRAQLQRELDALDAPEHLAAFDSAAVGCELRRPVDEWHALMTRNTPIARPVLDRLLQDRIDWTPRREDGIYEYRGRLADCSKGSSRRSRSSGTRTRCRSGSLRKG